MKKIILVLTLVCLSLGIYAQQQPSPDSEEYQKMKEEGKLSPPPAQEKRQNNYPVLLDAREKKSKESKQQDRKLNSSDPSAGLMTMSATPVEQSAIVIENPENDPSFHVLTANDDEYTSLINIPFTFNLFGSNYNSLYVNNNGNITFNMQFGEFSSTGFHNPTVDMVAPFWADVDTRVNGSGLVYYKVEPEVKRFTVIWYQVGYFGSVDLKNNTFKLILTDGTDPLIGTGNNVAFIYGDMQWTTGTASNGANGFGGTPATVGINKAKGENNCFFYQIGRFGKTGAEYIDAFENSGVEYLKGKSFFFDATTVEGVSANFNYANHFCAVNFTPEIENPQNCKINAYLWNFGDGSTSSESHPVHAFGREGTYTVKLDINYECGACSNNTISAQKQVKVEAKEEMFTEALLQVNTENKEQVISVSATTFSDAWPLQHINADLNEENTFLNGSQGVWRNEGTYVYEVSREASPAPNLAGDGTFTLENFNWEQAKLQAIPNWIKANSMTKYSPYSYELENENVLGIHSAALYDYGGHLPSANGVNMRHNEMAFTSFEYLDGTSSGNWIFGTQALPAYKILKVVSGNMNMAIVEAPLEELEFVEKADVNGKSISGSVFDNFNRNKLIQDNEIICRQSHPSKPELTVVVFRRAIFPGVWQGQLKIRNQVQPVVSPNIEETFAHTGKRSLKVSSVKVFRQNLLELDSGKTYFLSAWVSVKNPHVISPSIASNLGITIAFKNGAGTALSSVTLRPSGSVIEGWQQLRGSFVCPDRKAIPELSFLPGSTGTAWYDDLRMHPEEGNMKSYVYNLHDYRLQAILDEENFASYYYYDQEGNLYLVKKETVEGIKTISENISYQVKYGGN